MEAVPLTDTGSLFPVDIPSPRTSSADDDRGPIILLVFHRLPALTSTRHQTSEELSAFAIRVCGGVVKIRRGECLAGRADTAEDARAHGPGERGGHDCVRVPCERGRRAS